MTEFSKKEEELKQSDIESEKLINQESEIGRPFDWIDKRGVRGEKGIKYEGVVRYAQEKDRKGIEAVERDKWDERTSTGKRTYDPNKKPEIDELDKSFSEPDKQRVLVLTIGDDEEVVAWVSFGENYITEVPDPNIKYTELSTVTTMEKYKKNGFMKRLLKLAEREAQEVFGAQAIILSTQEENPETVGDPDDPKDIGFYRAVGYEQLPGRFKSKEGESWYGKSPYYSIHFVKYLKESDK